MRPDGTRLALPEALRPEPKSAHVRFFHTDHLGTPLQVIDTASKIHWQASPDYWRAVRDQRGARQPIRFQGQWEDEESGLYYNRYRYYDPGTSTNGQTYGDYYGGFYDDSKSRQP